MGKRSFKYNKRRALMCKLVRASKENKGYFRYDVTIGESTSLWKRYAGCLTTFAMEAKNR